MSSKRARGTSKSKKDAKQAIKKYTASRADPNQDEANKSRGIDLDDYKRLVVFSSVKDGGEEEGHLEGGQNMKNLLVENNLNKLNDLYRSNYQKLQGIVAGAGDKMDDYDENMYEVSKKQQAKVRQIRDCSLATKILTHLIQTNKIDLIETNKADFFKDELGNEIAKSDGLRKRLESCLKTNTAKTSESKADKRSAPYAKLLDRVSLYHKFIDGLGDKSGGFLVKHDNSEKGLVSTGDVKEVGRKLRKMNALNKNKITSALRKRKVNEVTSQETQFSLHKHRHQNVFDAKKCFHQSETAIDWLTSFVTHRVKNQDDEEEANKDEDILKTIPGKEEFGWDIARIREGLLAVLRSKLRICYKEDQKKDNVLRYTWAALENLVSRKSQESFITAAETNKLFQNILQGGTSGKFPKPLSKAITEEAPDHAVNKIHDIKKVHSSYSDEWDERTSLQDPSTEEKTSNQEPGGEDKFRSIDDLTSRYHTKPIAPFLSTLEKNIEERAVAEVTPPPPYMQYFQMFCKEVQSNSSYNFFNSLQIPPVKR